MPAEKPAVEGGDRLGKDSAMCRRRAGRLGTVRQRSQQIHPAHDPDEPPVAHDRNPLDVVLHQQRGDLARVGLLADFDDR